MTATKPLDFLWKLSVTLILVAASPTVFYSWLTSYAPDILEELKYIIIVSYALTSTVLILESWAACRLGEIACVKPVSSDSLCSLPACTAIVAAYLPNEQDIILETICHMLNRLDVERDKLQVILAYNTPHVLGVEVELQEIARIDPRLTLLHVVNSQSKAENINAALGMTSGEVVAIYDADHLPNPDAFHRAWNWLANGYDMVQGRCLIRNHDQNGLTRTVAIEFDTIYAVSHPGRAYFSGSAIFGGSNGYWKREVLAELRMNPAMLTEDIDVSVRALLAGYRLIHDRNIVSTELAPPQLSHLVSQRLRWAQGWLEVTLKHTGALMCSRHLSFVQKALWFYLLAWREIYPILAIQFLPLMLASAVTGVPINWFGSPLLIVLNVINWSCAPLVLLATYVCSRPHTRHGLTEWYWPYGLFSLFYTSFKLVIALVAQLKHMLHDRKWVTTPRTNSHVPLFPGDNGQTRSSRTEYRVLHGLLIITTILLFWNIKDSILYSAQKHAIENVPNTLDMRLDKATYDIEQLDYGSTNYVGIYHGGGANNRNQVVSSVSFWNDLTCRASIWNGVSRHDLPILPGFPQSMANAINQEGKIVGEMGSRYGLSQAVLWKEGSVQVLPQLPGYPYSVATALNDKGQVVGRAYPKDDAGTLWWARVAHAVIWEKGVVHDLGVPHGCIASRASSINNHGQVVGWTLTMSHERHAFLWKNGTMHDLGVLPGGHFSTAVAINDKNQIAGDSDDALGRRHIILWTGGKIQDLGIPVGCDWCRALAINAHGQIVGDAGNQTYVGNGRAFVWDIRHGIRYVGLPENSKWRLQRVLDIRDNGQIIVIGVSRIHPDPDGHRLLLLKPESM